MVSIIIPAYNAENTIIESLNSVFAQTYKNFEVIVVNDGSTDNTSNLLENYSHQIKILSTENKGVSHARNLGFMHSKGNYIQYLDADDLLVPEKLFIQLMALQENNADVAYGNWQKFRLENDQYIITESIIRQIDGDLELALFTDFWCPPAALLYSRRICEQLIWKENLPIIQDARYLLDAAIQGNFIYTPVLVAKYRIAQTHSLSQKSDLNFLKDLYQNTKEVYQLWKPNFEKQPRRKDAIIKSLRHCINRLTVLDKTLATEAIALLLRIEPNYIPPERGFLRFLSKIIGYKHAESLAGLKRSWKT